MHDGHHVSGLARQTEPLTRLEAQGEREMLLERARGRAGHTAHAQVQSRAVVEREDGREVSDPDARVQAAEVLLPRVIVRFGRLAGVSDTC